ncbi:nuclear transport factor 2 family protein [Actinoallomurus rhizosphaericola]|uniref:nuclear transport factor 2 family protein n=1 Tax=Actinoallomurus rhizosphaericola TaxID=2952536 RepID=UPI00209071DA|nr:nuclear transport factor 2 family protein [Actinoallomurus rhizosphaericola]MCO5994402.1 nuclear transport factor 2 family protein [Actinoallomurus rhizosphaericola]
MPATGPRQVFESFRARVLRGEWGAPEALRSGDVTIELPCAPPGAPRRFENGAEFHAHTEASRAALPVRFEEFRDVRVHETTDPEVVVVEYAMAGTVTTTGRSASAPFVLVLRVRDGRVRLWREYQPVLAIAEALGSLDALRAGVRGIPAPAPDPALSPWSPSGPHAADGLVSGPRAVYERILRAALDGSPDDYADLYAADAVLEFPFAAPGLPRSLRGREGIRAHLRAAMGGALKIEEFRGVVVHETTDPEVIVAEHAIVGTATASGLPCSIANLIVLTVRDGRIVHQRDYLDVLAAAAAAGR